MPPYAAYVRPAKSASMRVKSAKRGERHQREYPGTSSKGERSSRSQGQNEKHPAISRRAMAM